MKFKKLFILLATIFIFGYTNVRADTIYDVDVNVHLDKNANATITETWNVKADSGTEWYKQLYDIGKSAVSNYSVTMDGVPLTYKDWNINEELDQKAGYYGMINDSNGVQLCFGKSDYNNHTFVINYTVSNAVFNVSDAQVFNWTFFPKIHDGNDFKGFKIVIESYYEFPENLDVWGYGYKGYAYVENGVIKASNVEDGDMTDQYIAIQIKFPKGIFDTTYTNPNFETFDDVHKAAEEGKFDYDYGNKLTIWQKILNFIKRFFWLIFMGIITVIGTIAASKNGYGYKNDKTIDKKNVPNFRDIPCNKDIYYANALLFLNNFDYKETNILGAIILKWVKQEKVGFIKQDTGIFKKEQSCLDLRKKPKFEAGSREEQLFNMMYEASEDGILEPNEFKRWAKSNYDSFFNVFKGLKDDEVNKLRSEGHIYTRTNKEECKKHNVMDDKIYEDSTKLYGLKKFLQEFSSIDTKETLEVHIWEEYLMFAYLFGIADKVAKQLKNLYPELLEQNQNMDYTTIMMINHFSATTVSAASSARSAAEHYSAGGGGFSSGGGGGGSFGGGGSWGGR